MKKKILLVIVLVLMCGLLCGCNNTYIDKDDKEHTRFMGNFIVISENNCLAIVYDINTKVVYYWYNVGYHSAMSPYYITENGNAIVAIYGVNYH